MARFYTANAKAAQYPLAKAYAQRAINRQNPELFERALALGNATLSVRERTKADALASGTHVIKLDGERAPFAEALSAQGTSFNVLMNRPAEFVAQAAGIRRRPRRCESIITRTGRASSNFAPRCGSRGLEGALRSLAPLAELEAIVYPNPLCLIRPKRLPSR